MLVPGRGWTVHETSVLDETVFLTLGPFSSGDVIDFVEVFWATGGVTTLFFSASLGSSVEPSQEALDAGIPIIQRSSNLQGRTPALFFDVLAADNGEWRVPVGIEVRFGVQFMTVAVRSSAVLVRSDWVVTAHVVRAA